MARPVANRPTDQELEILKVLWQLGPSSVREVWKKITAEREIGYTSVLKIMQIMREKELVICDTETRPQSFRPRQQRKMVLRQLAGDLLNRAFEGSTQLLLMHALESQRTSPAELVEIRRMLDNLEAER